MASVFEIMVFLSQHCHCNSMCWEENYNKNRLGTSEPCIRDMVTRSKLKVTKPTQMQ